MAREAAGVAAAVMPLATTLIAAPLARSQEAPDVPAPSDTTPFRRGQWAAQFGGGFSLASLGLLRFTSSRSAWLLDARVSGQHAHGEDKFPAVAATSDTTIRRFTSNASVSFRAGRRFHQRPSHEILSFVSLGLLGGFTHAAAGEETSAWEGNGWSAGAFGELGGTYLFNPHVGIGPTADVAIAYNRSTYKSSDQPPPFQRTTWSYSVSAPNLRFVATLFF